MSTDQKWAIRAAKASVISAVCAVVALVVSGTADGMQVWGALKGKVQLESLSPVAWFLLGTGTSTVLFALVSIALRRRRSDHSSPGNRGTTPPAVVPRTIHRQCGGFKQGPHAPVRYQPCIERVGDQLQMSVEVVSLDTVVEPVDVTVFVWLYDGSTSPRYRADDTLVACRMTFTAPDQTQVCGPHPVLPPKGRTGRYATSSSAELTRLAGEYPRGWNDFRPTGPDPGFTGSQSGGLTWA